MSKYTDGLRELADFLDEHDVPELSWQNVRFDIFADDAAGLMERARNLGGAWDKEEKGDWFVLRRYFGPHCIDINAPRSNVCERVQVGTKTVEKPDPSAPLVTVEEPVYEWQCPESLSAVASWWHAPA